MTAFTLQKALGLRNVPFFCFCSPGLGLRVLAFAVWACFPPGWNGGFHLWRLSDESLGRGRTFLDQLILPVSRALGARLPGLSGSWPLELLPPSRSGCVQLPLPLLFITPFAILVFPRENFGFEVLTVSSAPDSERAITFGSFSLLGIALRPRLLLIE